MVINALPVNPSKSFGFVTAFSAVLAMLSPPARAWRQHCHFSALRFGNITTMMRAAENTSISAA